MLCLPLHRRRAPHHHSRPHRARSESPPHFPEHVTCLNVLLNEYRRHQEGPEPTPKLRENVGGKIYRIKNFLSFMAKGRSKLHTLTFLNDMDRIRGWVHSLRKKVIVDTTINHYLKNVAQFIDYVVDTPTVTCRLSKKALVGVRREVRSLIRGLKRQVTVHQMAVKRSKDGRLISKQTLIRCRALAKAAIPRIFDQLVRDFSQKTQFLLYGYLTAYLGSIYGHRCGVYQNLTIKEVEEAVHSGEVFLINVNTHKTNQAFGPAQLALVKEEYGWFKRLLSIKDKLVGGTEAVFFFYTSKKNPCKNLNKYLQMAWKEMGLTGTPTFTDLRSAIATHARNSHGADSRLKISKFMCHNTSTADKFYAVNLNCSQAMDHRRLFEAALEGPDISPDKVVSKKRKAADEAPCSSKHKRSSPCRSSSPGSTTTDEEEPVYQESGVSFLDEDEDLEEPQDLEEPRPTPRRMLPKNKRPMVILTPLKFPRRAILTSPVGSTGSSRRSPHTKSSSSIKGPSYRRRIIKTFTPLGVAKATKAKAKVQKALKTRAQKKKKPSNGGYCCVLKFVQTCSDRNSCVFKMFNCSRCCLNVQCSCFLFLNSSDVQLFLMLPKCLMFSFSVFKLFRCSFVPDVA
ncbi:uncharacterized protein [Misgurnus anguillicaudatus]|uniref:uncharacterized protein isoform X1 n=1 Tax=Misgurnus anguillicaudatus TaxID=75329 RepID=UPI003CCF4341